MSATTSSGEDLVAAVLAGDRRALARALTLIENGDPAVAGLLAGVFPATGRALTVGFTGAPGVGKSTLAGAVVRHLRANRRSVGVVSVDPSSPFTQGALLGDRIRLAEHFLDPEVFIRSMGSRGHTGGLAGTTGLAVALLDAAGKDVVLVETVGAGQGETEVIGIVDLVVVVVAPGGGDGVQALKAGTMEIPDVIAVNKRNHPETAATVADLRAAVALEPDSEVRPAIVETEALAGEGIEDLWTAVEERRATIDADGRLAARRRRGLEQTVVGLAVEQLRVAMARRLTVDPELRTALEQVADRVLDPLAVAHRLVASVRSDSDDD